MGVVNFTGYMQHRHVRDLDLRRITLRSFQNQPRRGHGHTGWYGHRTVVSDSPVSTDPRNVDRVHADSRNYSRERRRVSDLLVSAIGNARCGLIGMDIAAKFFSLEYVNDNDAITGRFRYLYCAAIAKRVRVFRYGSVPASAALANTWCGASCDHAHLSPSVAILVTSRGLR